MLLLPKRRRFRHLYAKPLKTKWPAGLWKPLARSSAISLVLAASFPPMLPRKRAMKIDRVIFDTGPLVAVLSAKDSLHEWAVELFSDLPSPGLTCEAVLSETFFRLRKDDKATGALCAMIDSGAFRVIPVASMGGIARYVMQYRVD